MNTIRRQIKRLKSRVMPVIAPKPMVISFPKCGRTWIANVLLNYIHYSQNPDGSPVPYSIKPQFKTIVKGTPFEPIIFSHDVFSMKIPINDWERKSAARHIRKQTALLVRDPRDTLVSLYHHAIGRRHKNNLSEDTTIREFLETYEMGTNALIAFLNVWAPAAAAHESVQVFTYENLLGSWEATSSVWTSLTGFVTNRTVDPTALQRAVEENAMKALKRRLMAANDVSPGVVDAGGRLRKGKASNYLHELSPDDIEFIESSFVDGLNREAKELNRMYFTC